MGEVLFSNKCSMCDGQFDVVDRQDYSPSGTDYLKPNMCFGCCTAKRSALADRQCYMAGDGYCGECGVSAAYEKTPEPIVTIRMKWRDS